MSGRLEGQVALITGAGRGQGRSHALALAAEGADVVLCDAAKDIDTVPYPLASADDLAETERLVLATGRRCLSRVVDVRDSAGLEQLVTDAIATFGRIDICVANAGTSGGGRFTDLSLAEWRRVMAINLDGAFLTMRDCARQMVEQGDGGAIVAISSTSAIHGAPNGAHYGASKTALLGLVRAMAVGLARHRIRVNSVLPGWTRTELAEGGYQNDHFREVTTSRTPVRRWATGDDYRELAAYLCDRDQLWHTGDEIVADGGYTIF